MVNRSKAAQPRNLGQVNRAKTGCRIVRLSDYADQQACFDAAYRMTLSGYWQDANVYEVTNDAGDFAGYLILFGDGLQFKDITFDIE